MSCTENQNFSFFIPCFNHGVLRVKDTHYLSKWLNSVQHFHIDTFTSWVVNQQFLVWNNFGGRTDQTIFDGSNVGSSYTWRGQRRCQLAKFYFLGKMRFQNGWNIKNFVDCLDGQENKGPYLPDCGQKLWGYPQFVATENTEPDYKLR